MTGLGLNQKEKKHLEELRRLDPEMKGLLPHEKNPYKVQGVALGEGLKHRLQRHVKFIEENNLPLETSQSAIIRKALIRELENQEALSKRMAQMNNE